MLLSHYRVFAPVYFLSQLWRECSLDVPWGLGNQWTGHIINTRDCYIPMALDFFYIRGFQTFTYIISPGGFVTTQISGSHCQSFSSFWRWPENFNFKQSLGNAGAAGLGATIWESLFYIIQIEFWTSRFQCRTPLSPHFTQPIGQAVRSTLSYLT